MHLTALSALLTTSLAFSTFAANVTTLDNPAVTVTVDASSGQHPIDPRIYGSSWADAEQIATLGLTLNRWGGNAMSRYNWAFSTANRCKDYFFYNIPDVWGPGAGANGKSADDFITMSLGAGAHPVMTIPMLSLLPEDDQKQCSFPQSLYPNQEAFSNPAWEPIMCGNGRFEDGNGIVGDGPRILPPSLPDDTTTAYPLSHQGDWIQHMIDTHGSAAGGGVRHYSLDNEPQLWSSDHWDVHPIPTSYDEAWEKMSALGAIIREKDPSAVITGGEEWGWWGYFESALDIENGNTADRDDHEGKFYYPWLLEQFADYEAVHGERILDVLTAHFYPQGGEFATGDTTEAMQLRRNRSTRALWDPTYEDESWIRDRNYDEPWPVPTKVKLIPRLKQWVAENYPGTEIGITEYNWGDPWSPEGDHINYGTAQADVLGIFGREGVDMAVRWGTPEVDSFAGLAFRMYRNYDGNGAKFGDTSISASAPDPDEVAAFASLRSTDGALTVMLIAKSLTGDTPTTINLAGFSAAAPVERWQLDSTRTITRRPDLAPIGSELALTLPPQSVTLLVVPPADVPEPPQLQAAASGAARVVLTWSAVANATSYDVFRGSGGGELAFLENTGDAGLTWNDDTVVADTTYLYRVRAVVGGGTTELSNMDPATTVAFTDAPLLAGVHIKGVHISELRTAVNAMRAAAGLGAFDFTDAIGSATPVKALHFTELRNALDAARADLGLSALAYTDTPLVAGTTKAKAVQVEEIRAGVR